MREIVTQIMKRHIRDELPFFIRSFAFHLHPEMLNPSFGQMIWVSVLPQPRRALAGENVSTLLIPLLLIWILWEEILIECPTGHIMQIQRPGLAAFCIKKRDTAGPLIDLALIEPQGGNFTDPQSCPVAEREDGSETAAAVLFDELLEHKALLLRKL